MGVQKKETCKTLQIPNQLQDSDKYCRIGTLFYKYSNKIDKFGNSSEFLTQTSRQTLIDDHGKGIIKKVSKFDGFCNVPNNLNVRTCIYGNYNMYQQLQHKPQQGEFKTISTLLNHIFNEHIELGLDYLQIMYLDPTQMLPVLCLVSKENQTGKTTFANLLKMIFGGNAITLGKSELETQFNGSYASKLAIVFDESKVEQKYMDKLRALSTTPLIQLRLMRTDYTELDFFGKIILLSNHTKNFINVNEYDIRFWVRKLKPLESFDPTFDDKLKAEIPAFLDYLQHRKLTTTKQGRAWFTPEQIATKELVDVQKNSKSWLCKELEENLLESLYITDEILVSPKDLKTYFFNSDNKIGTSDIKKVLTDELGLTASKPTWYTNIFSPIGKTGRVYTLTKDVFL